MNTANYRISLDIHNMSSQVVLAVKKGDTGRRIVATLTQNGKPYILTEDCRAVFTAKKADGNILYNDCSVAGNTISYAFTPQTTSSVGKADCEIKLYGADGKLLTSARFTIVVEDTVYNEGDEVESEKEVSALTKLVSEASSLINTVETKLANGDFVGKPGPVGPAGADGTVSFDELTEEQRESLCGPIVSGEGKYSAQGGVDNQAISEAAFTYGKANFVGLKGYYYSGIDFDAKTITLSKKQNVADAEGIQVTWEVGDEVTIVNNSHYDRCSKITAINGNVITVDSFPFTEVVTPPDPNWDDCSIFVPDKPEAGIVDLGRCATAIGENNAATERAATAIGRQNIVQGKYGVALGRLNKVKAYAGVALGRGNVIESTAMYASAEGVENVVSGEASHAEGAGNKAIGKCSHAEGYHTEASGDNSHSQGYKTIASGLYAHAEGFTTVSSGESSHAEGSYSEASGKNSHAEGYRTKASGEDSHAEGNQSVAPGLYAHAEGYDTMAEGEGAHAEGVRTKALENSAHAEGRITVAEGSYSHAEGYNTKATGMAAHAEGNSTEAANGTAHAEGKKSKALGAFSHAEGLETSASGEAAHSQGRETIASGAYAHAGGYKTTASGESSFAIGQDTVAEGKASLAGGRGTKTISPYQTAFGMYNEPDKNYLLMVGNGSSDTTRANAFAVKDNGHSDFFGHKAMNIANAVVDTDAVNLRQLNAGLAKKAPAGYGLGGDATTDDEFMAIVDRCLAEMPGDSIQHVSIMQGGRHSVTIRKHLDGYADIEDISYAPAVGFGAYYFKRVRSLYGGNWYPWEWVNPPMIPGVEYRTTERWNGKAVYVQMLNFGALPNSTAKVMDVSVSGATMVQCIDLGGIFGNASGTTTGALLGLKELAGHSFDNTASGFALGLITNGDVSAYNAYPVVKYTKD